MQGAQVKSLTDPENAPALVAFLAGAYLLAHLIAWAAIGFRFA